MNTKSIITSLALVLGLAVPAVAGAAPQHREVDRTYHHAPVRVVVRHEPARPIFERPRPVFEQPVIQHSYWVQLAQSFRLNRDGRMSVSDFAPTNAREITIGANGCATRVDQVAIMYTDGTEQLERALNFRIDGQQALTLGTNPYKQISRVVVYGPQGSFDQSLTLSALI